MKKNKQHSVASLLTLLVAAFFLLFSNHAFAQTCSSPAGASGNVMYNSAYHVPQFCDGLYWRAMGPNPGTGGSGCTLPAGTEGGFVYNSAYHVMQYCDGTKWRAMGPNPGTGGSGCSSPSGVEGNIISNGAPAYCDGTRWRVMAATVVNTFNFTDVVGQPLSSTITSNAITITGGTENAVATCGTGCTDIIVNGTDCSCTSTTVDSGNTVAIKQVSSSSYGTLTSATLTVGAASDTWNVTTQNTANAFNLTDMTGVPQGTSISSADTGYTPAGSAVTLSWSGGGTLPAVCGSGCTDIIRNGVDCSCTTLSGFASGDTIAIKQTSSASANTTTNATVTVGSTSNTWSVTTVTIDAFNFTNFIDVTPSTLLPSDDAAYSGSAVTLTGGATNQTATCGTGCTDIIINGVDCSCTTKTGVNSGDTIAIKQTSSASYTTATTAKVTVGPTTSGTWSVTTLTPCTKSISSSGTFVPTVSETISYSLYGGNGGNANSPAAVAGTHTTGSVAVTAGVTYTVYVGGSGGGDGQGNQAAGGGGGGGYYGGGGGADDNTSGAGGGGGSTVLLNGTTVLACAAGGKGAGGSNGGTPGGGGTCTGLGASGGGTFGGTHGTSKATGGSGAGGAGGTNAGSGGALGAAGGAGGHNSGGAAPAASVITYISGSCTW